MKSPYAPNRKRINGIALAAMLVISFIAGAIFSPIEESEGFTYRFDESTPFSESQREAIAAEVQAKINTSWDQDNGNRIVIFLDYDTFAELFGDKASAFNDAETGRIYFNKFDYPAVRVSKFVLDLIHELGHAWGLGHSTDRLSVMYDTYDGKQTLTVADRWNFLLAQMAEAARLAA